MDISILSAFLIYFGILCIIGIAAQLQSDSSTEFILGNRSINYWITAIAAHASDMSAWLFMGFPAAIYMQGLVASWIAVGLFFGMLISWHYIAQPLRIATEHYNALTISSFLHKRFADRFGMITFISSLSLIIFFIVYIAAGLTGLGYVFETVFQVDYELGMTIGLLISLSYVLAGGFIAVAWNHFFQGMFLLAMIALVPWYAFSCLPDGWETISFNAMIRNVSLSFLPTTAKSCLDILNGLMWGVGYLGMPHIIINYMGINNPERIQKAKYIGMSWLVISLFAAIFVGLVGIGFYLTGLHNPELVFVHMVQDLFNPFIAGLVLCAILAATMSTIDTQLLVASSSITQDILSKLLSKMGLQMNGVWWNRASLVLVAGLSYIIAWQKNASIMDLVSYAWSGLASTFSPTIVVALYAQKRYSPTVIFLGMFTGALVSGIWPWIYPDLLPLIPGCIAHCGVLYLLS